MFVNLTHYNLVWYNVGKARRLLVEQIHTTKGSLSMIDLLVLTGLDTLILKSKIFFIFVTKQATLIRRLTAQSLPLQLVFPTLVICIYGIN